MFTEYVSSASGGWPAKERSDRAGKGVGWGYPPPLRICVFPKCVLVGGSFTLKIAVFGGMRRARTPLDQRQGTVSPHPHPHGRDF